MKSKKLLMSASVLLFTLSGCQSANMAASAEAAAPPSVVNVAIVGTAGKQIGTAKLQQVAEGVRIQLEVTGLKPGVHGFHIHEKGVCEAPDFTSAGGHLNPLHKQHGFKNPKGPHAGDLPNLTVDSQGNGRMDVISKEVVLLPDKPNSLFKPGGTSLVIHEQPDDMVSDPAGNSGKRVACGVVK
ncbi:superoxide dismutase family protein [Paenibacillus hexagrammi]|uniref:Superoxide dismutase [Cu-Zn] n=1 Tax=Paenibacillus hexagrammi TaxID=2908839 RepID=A0ABY3SP14_9BACL|nr:superoxide dismutase family protein [Paenibacillus sp. YPD9-1]UJF35203.1 superoxide dismutase family protein [Paenibacillus sp. YPD9-1]